MSCWKPGLEACHACGDHQSPESLTDIGHDLYCATCAEGRRACDSCDRTGLPLVEDGASHYCETCAQELAEKLAEAEFERHYGGVCPTLTERMRGAA